MAISSSGGRLIFHTSHRFLCALPVLFLLATGSATIAFDSGRAATTDIQLAISDFVRNGISEARDINYGGRTGGFLQDRACPGYDKSPQQIAAEHLLFAATQEMRGRQAIQVVGSAMLDGVSQALQAHPATKGVGTAVGLLNQYLNSDSATDFALNVLKDKLKGRAGGAAQEVIGDEAYEALSILYEAIDRQLQETIAQQFGRSITMPSRCKTGGQATFTVSVDPNTHRLVLRLDAVCDCEKGDTMKEYHAIMEGSVRVSLNDDDELEWRLLGRGMRFWGSCCGEPPRTTRVRTAGTILSPNAGVAQTPGVVAQPEGPACTEEDCEKIVDEMKRLDDEIKELKDLRKDLQDAGAQNHTAVNDLNQLIGEKISQIEQLCHVWNNCDCPKDPQTFFRNRPWARALIGKLCVRHQYGMLDTPSRPVTGGQNVSYIPSGVPTQLTLAYDRSDCSFGGGMETIPIGDPGMVGMPPPNVPPPTSPGEPSTSEPPEEPTTPGTPATPGEPTTPAPPDSPSTGRPPTEPPTSQPPPTGLKPPETTPGIRPPTPVPPIAKPPTDLPEEETPTGEPPAEQPPTTMPPTEKPPTEEPPPEEPSTEEPPPTTIVVLIIKATEKVLQEGSTTTHNVATAQLKGLNPEPESLPFADGTKRDDTGFDQDGTYFQKLPDGQGYALQMPVSATKQTPTVTTAGGQPATSKLPVAGQAFQQQVNLDLTPMYSLIVGFVIKDGSTNPQDYLPDGLTPHDNRSFAIGNVLIVPLRYPRDRTDQINQLLEKIQKLFSELDLCRTIQGTPSDPYFLSKSTWKQDYDDQWAIKHVGFTADPTSAWNVNAADPVTVAVIDTGMDWNHKDFSWDNLWKNPKEIPENGLDDDKNGYIDDIIGYDFFQRNKKPWDQNGHGTFVAGVIAAAHNDTGIAGINPHAKLMVLKALNGFGHTRASYLAEAITYAANNGARVINISVGGPNLTQTEQLAIDYAESKGALVVVAAGNEAVDVANFGPAGSKHAFTVSSSDLHDKRAAYSNWGAGIDIAAPGDDVLSLRARRTDLMRDVVDVKYTAGTAYVGVDKRYYRASGTSFAAPIVAGTASLILSVNPSYTNEEVRRMILQSAQDIDVPGTDQHTGYGLLDARSALQADPNFFIIAGISEVNVVMEGNAAKVQVAGTVDADKFQSAHLELGAGKEPAQWKRVSEDLTQSRQNSLLGTIAASEFAGSKEWTLRVVVEHQNGKTRQAWFNLQLQ